MRLHIAQIFPVPSLKNLQVQFILAVHVLPNQSQIDRGDPRNLGEMVHHHHDFEALLRLMAGVETREKSDIHPDDKIVCSDKAQTTCNQPNLVNSTQDVARAHKNYRSPLLPILLSLILVQDSNTGCRLETDRDRNETEVASWRERCHKLPHYVLESKSRI
jgi:hypothetical protein